MPLSKIKTNSVASEVFEAGENLFINGNYSIFQRGTSATGVTTDTYAAPDRWKTRVTDTSEFTISQSTDVPSGEGFAYSCKWDCTTANASPAATAHIIHEQRMEGQNLQHLEFGTSSAKKLTLSFWVKSNKTGTYSYGFYSADGVRHLNSTYSISTANTWQKVTKTFDGDTGGTINNDNGEALKVWFWLQAGSNFTSGTHETTNWAAYSQANAASSSQVNLADSTSNDWYITGCKLEVGSVATPFIHESRGETLRKCQRYYDQSSVSTGSGPWYFKASQLADTYGRANIEFKVRMRATPTVTVVNNNTNYTSSGMQLLSAHMATSYINGMTSSSYNHLDSWTANAEL